MRSSRIAPAFLFRKGHAINTVMNEAPQEIEITLLSSAMTSDAAEVVSLLEAQLDEHAIPRPEGSGGIAAVVRGMTSHPERGFILVAKEKGRAVGVAYLAATWTLEKGGPALWLEELYVEPALRGRGIGQRLVEESCRQAVFQGYLSIDLEVEESHARAANLYRRLGFCELPRRRFTRWADGRPFTP